MDRPERVLRDVSDKRRLLIASLYYWPEPSGNAPYVTEMAEHLADRDWNVTVVTGFPHYPQWRLVEGHSGFRSSEINASVRIERYRHYVPRRPTTSRRALYEATFLANAILHRYHRFHAVIGVIPALSDGLLARSLARRGRIPYGLVFQDVVSRAAGQVGLAGGSAVAGALRSVERRVAVDAARVGIVAEDFRAHLLHLGVEESRIDLLPNWSQGMAPATHPHETRRNLGWPSTATVVLHAGNMGAKQDLVQLADVARLAAQQEQQLLFVFLGEGSEKTRLISAANDLPNVRFLPPQDPDRFADILAAADVLLVHERAGITGMSLPSKLTSYFAAGKPILAAVSPIGTTAREVTRSGGGVVVDPIDPAGVLDELRRLHRDPHRREQLGSSGTEHARRNLDRKTLLGRVEAFVDRVVGRDA